MSHDQCLFCACHYENLVGESKELADEHDLECTLELDPYSNEKCIFCAKIVEDSTV